MRELKELKPETTYLFTKEILGINEWFPKKRKAWSVKTYRKKLRIFVLPIGRILGFSIVKNKLMFVVKFHPREIIERVPRHSRDQAYMLRSDQLGSYLSGELPPIAGADAITYEGDDLGQCMRKRMANMLQSFTIDYNHEYDRKDRLSARYTGIFELETPEEVRRVLSEIQSAPLIHSDKSSLDTCFTNSFHLADPSIRQVVSYDWVIELFGGSIKAFEDSAREVRKKLKELVHAFRYFEQLPPGRYLIRG